MRILWIALTTVILATGWRIARHGFYLQRQRHLMMHPSVFAPIAPDPVRSAGQWPNEVDTLLGGSRGVPVLIHERRTPTSGDALLVVVSRLPDAPNAQYMQIQTTLYSPASFLPSSAIRFRASFAQSFPFVKITGARVDTNDPSHFTISYELNGEQGEFDGWVEGSQNAFLEVRSGPLKR